MNPEALKRTAWSKYWRAHPTGNRSSRSGALRPPTSTSLVASGLQYSARPPPKLFPHPLKISTVALVPFPLPWPSLLSTRPSFQSSIKVHTISDPFGVSTFWAFLVSLSPRSLELNPSLCASPSQHHHHHQLLFANHLSRASQPTTTLHLHKSGTLQQPIPGSSVICLRPRLSVTPNTTMHSNISDSLRHYRVPTVDTRSAQSRYHGPVISASSLLCDPISVVVRPPPGLYTPSLPYHRREVCVFD